MTRRKEKKRSRKYGRKIRKLQLTKVSQGSRRAALFFLLWAVVGGGCPTFLVFHFLYNNMVYTLDIGVYIPIQNIFVQNNFLAGLIFSTSWGVS